MNNGYFIDDARVTLARSDSFLMFTKECVLDSLSC